MEAHDHHPLQTAVRETQEEIGLDAAHIEVIGYLDPYQTVTGFRVTPVVAMVEPGFSLALDRFEVAEVFEVPLQFVLDPANHLFESRTINGQRRRFYVLSYRQHRIWGATAAMLVNLYQKLC
jgi:8-oxo-dGTP pyrophosphatase MutT (NUDIX family)